jgi:hypothetical protein
MDELDLIRKIPEFSKARIYIGIPFTGPAVRDQMRRMKWGYNRLSSQTRIPAKRIYEIIEGFEPTAEEFKKLRMLMPEIPSWRPPNSKHKPSVTPKESELVVQVESLPPPSPPVEVVSEKIAEDELRISLLKYSISHPEEKSLPKLPEPSKPVPPPTPRTPIASDYPTLTDAERIRVQEVEDAILKLCERNAAGNLKTYKRIELFPNDIKGDQWPSDFLRKLQSVKVIIRIGATFHSKYQGVPERIDKLLGDAEWLLRLTAPLALRRTPPAPESDPESEEAEQETGTDFSEAPVDLGINSDVASETLRLVSGYYEVLAAQRDSIVSFQEEMKSVNAKLNAIMEHLGIQMSRGPDDPS